MKQITFSRPSKWEREDFIAFLALVGVGSVAVGYELGSVLAGDAFEPLWLVPILGLIVVLGSMLETEARRD